MEIEYKNKRIEKVCTNASYAIKNYGDAMAKKIDQRIGEITAADSIEEMVGYGIGRCHPLHHNRQGQYAVDLCHPQRLIFEKKAHNVKIVTILEIDDYH